MPDLRTRNVPSVEDDEELSRGQRFLKWWRSVRGVLASLALVLAVVAAWKGKAMYGAAKVWRAEGLIARAEAAEFRGDEAAAQENLRKAGALLLRHPLMLRAVARHKARSYDPACLELFEALGKAQAATAGDWVDFTRVALRHGLVDRIERGFQELRAYPTLADSPVVLRLRAEGLAIGGHWSEALAAARRAVANLAAQPGADERLFLARLLLRLPPSAAPEREANIGEAIALLGQVALRPDRVGTEALEELSALPRNPAAVVALPTSEIGAWISAAAANPFTNEDLRVNLWTLRLATDTPQRAAILADFCQHFGAAPLPARLAAVRWLNQRGEFARAREMSAAVKGTSGDWFMAYLDAVAGLGDWEEVLREVESEAPVPLPAAVRRLFRLRAKIVLGQKPDVQFEWNMIHLALSPSDIPQEMYVAGYAEEIGFPQAAAQTYQQVLNTLRPVTPGAPKALVTQRLQCYLGLLRSSADTLPLAELSALMDRFAGEFPDLDEAQNDAAYLRLLMGQGAAADEAATRQLLAKKPALLAYRTTAALASLRAQHFPEALALYDGWQIQWENAPERYRAVYAAVLEANGRADEAAKMRATIRSEALRAEERTLAALSP
jgi:hypothetical protein